eukprot:m.414516 g.414516  ORF g.414516 m.414516 type:complete len:199 (+) comp29352_c0_seq1:89-685(+)
MALPVFKLAYIFAKQIAKPIGKRLVSYSHSNQWVSSNMVEPIGQAAHWLTVRSDRIIAGNWRSTVRRIQPEMALEWGSAVLSESIVFGVAAGFVVVEYRDKDIKEAEKKKMLQEWRDQVSETTRVLDEKVEELSALHDATEAVLREEIADLRAAQQYRWGLGSIPSIGAVVGRVYAGVVGSQQPTAASPSQEDGIVAV